MGIKEVGAAALKLLGVDPVAVIDKTAEIVDRFVQSPEEKASLALEFERLRQEERKLSFEREIEFRKAELESYRAEVEDRASARQMKQEWIQKLLALLITVFFFAFCAFLLFFLGKVEMTDAQSNIVFTMFGAVSSLMMLVAGFYFGSSAGSQAKNDLIKVQQAAQTAKE